MLKQGVDIRIIQILLGLSSMRSTEVYTHLTESLRDDLRQLLRRTTFDTWKQQGATTMLERKRSLFAVRREIEYRPVANVFGQSRA